ncbi:ATP-binding protein [Candidatus Woesearchaeota archaeon]|nr:ATP-binding protein [Candidatus Woesearchaeota archaeon]
MSYDIPIGRNESDKKKFGKRGLAYIGKTYVKMGQYTSLSNKLYMDISRSHVILLAGKRGSGKSYTLGVLTEELANLPESEGQNIASIIFDTMGIYWTMKFRNDKDKELLSDWGLKSQSLPVKVFVPFGYYDKFSEKGVPIDHKFALDVSQLNPEDWILTFNLEIMHPVATLIQRTLTRIKNERKDFIIKDIIEEIEKDKKSSIETVNAAAGLFEAAETWGIFSKYHDESTKINDLINAGTTSVLDLSMYNSVGAFNIRALVISLLSRKIFNERMEARKAEEIQAISKGINYGSSTEKKQVPLVWIFIDEAHEFLPKEGKTIATDALVQILREGRQPGISLVLATQQPGQIHKDVMTQSDIVIAHRVTSEQDITALNSIMQTYLTSAIQKYMNDLPDLKGSAIILDDNSERIYPMRIRPRFTWHGGEAPTAIGFESEL